jgi:7-cyano-7-deazaguanine synthase in queuosine biosynthesis
MSEKKKEAVVLNSGGIDSRVAAKMMKDEGYVLHSIYVHANRRKEQNKKAAEKTAELYCVDHFVYEYPVDWFKVKDKNKKWRGVPYNVLMSHVIGAQYASFLGLDVVFTGLKSEGREINYSRMMTELLATALQTSPVAIKSPLYDKSSVAVIEMAKEQKIPLEDTYSCSIYPPCGKCAACIKRKKFGL